MNTEVEVITDFSKKDVFRVAHKFTSLRGSEWRPSEIDFLFSFISEIQKDDDKFKRYEVSKEQLQKKMKRRLRKERVLALFRTLAKKHIEVDTEKKTAVYNVFQTLEFDKETETFTVLFSEDMRPFLLKLKPFTQGYLSDIFKCEGEYEKKLYLFLSQWLGAGKVKVETEWLMEQLQVTKSYKIYNRFKEKVLKLAKRNFAKNELSIQFDFKEIKEKRKVTELEFTIWQIVKSVEKEEATLIDASAEDESVLIAPYIGKKIFLRSIQKSGIITQIREEAHETGKWKIYVELADGKGVKLPMPYTDLASMLASLQSSNFEV